MRSVQELRRLWVSSIPEVMARTSMYASTGSEMELRADDMLRNLCFVDDRDADYQASREELLARYGKLGVSGPFSVIFDLARCQAEVAAVYAEVYSRLGYFHVENAAEPDRWRALTERMPALIDDKDMRLSQAEREFGPATLIVDRRILCYASSYPDDGWIFVDGHEQRTGRYDPTIGRYETTFERDPLVRSVRRSAGDFEEGLILTRYGKFLRWGDDWWIDHPHSRWSRESIAIAAQLRQIRDNDPSQQSGENSGREF